MFDFIRTSLEEARVNNEKVNSIQIYSIQVSKHWLLRGMPMLSARELFWKTNIACSESRKIICLSALLNVGLILLGLGC